jgi:anti-sigma regulatory factor (Ser/Thr protein kinase)
MSQNGPSAPPGTSGADEREGMVDDASTESSSLPPAAPGAAASTEALRHASAVVASDADLLGCALPFLDAGLRAGDLVALTCTPETVELIRAELGERATAVVSEPRISLLGARPPDALDTARKYLEQAAGRGSGRLRVLSEIDFGPEPADWREGQRFESVTNRLLSGAPVSTVCVYDRRRLPAPVVDSALATHPHQLTGATWSPNPSFQDPRAYVPALPLPREPVEDGEPVFAVEDAPTLAGLRRRLAGVLAARVPDPDQAEDLHLAVSEIAANAFRHGVRPVSARLWAEGDRLVCVVSDAGTSYGDPFSGFTPAHGLDLSRGGMGLWLARKLWDHVDVLPGPRGLSVRLSTRLR